jgi:hypothetical protein
MPSTLLGTADGCNGRHDVKGMSVGTVVKAGRATALLLSVEPYCGSSETMSRT